MLQRSNAAMCMPLCVHFSMIRLSWDSAPILCCILGKDKQKTILNENIEINTVCFSCKIRDWLIPRLIAILCVESAACMLPKCRFQHSFTLATTMNQWSDTFCFCCCSPRVANNCGTLTINCLSTEWLTCHTTCFIFAWEWTSHFLEFHQSFLPQTSSKSCLQKSWTSDCWQWHDFTRDSIHKSESCPEF